MIGKILRAATPWNGLKSALAIFSCCFVMSASAEEVLSVDELDAVTDVSGLKWQNGEKYDPFKGTIKHIVTDFRIAGEGPDLIVARDGARVLIPTLQNADKSMCVTSLKDDGDNRQILSELAKRRLTPLLDIYGSSHSFYYKGLVGNAGDYGNALYISPDNWVIKCSGEVAVIHSPNGTRYTLGTASARYPVTGELTRIDDTSGNWLQYKHSDLYVDGNKTIRKLDSITASDNRKVAFNYDANTYRNNALTGLYPSGYTDSETSSPKARSRTISGNRLTAFQVTREDGRQWKYTYASGGDIWPRY